MLIYDYCITSRNIELCSSNRISFFFLKLFLPTGCAVIVKSCMRNMSNIKSKVYSIFQHVLKNLPT